MLLLRRLGAEMAGPDANLGGVPVSDLPNLVAAGLPLNSVLIRAMVAGCLITWGE